MRLINVLLLIIINTITSYFLSKKIVNYNIKSENITNNLKRNWIYNYAENYFFIKNNYLFSVKNDKLLWKVKIDNNKYQILEFEKKNLIILFSNDNMKLLSYKTGKIIWNIELEKYNYKLPCLNDKNIFLLGNNKIYFINIKSGNIDKVVNLKSNLKKLKNDKNNKKEVSVKILYLNSSKKNTGTKKYFFSLYRLNTKGNLINKFILEKSKNNQYFNDSDEYFINKESIFRFYKDNLFFNSNKIIAYNNNQIIYKRDFKVYYFDIIKNKEFILFDENIDNIFILKDKYIFFTRNKIICKNLNALYWEYELDYSIDYINFYKSNIVFNDGLYKLKSINFVTGKLNWTFNSSSIIFSFFISYNNLYLTTALADLKSKNYIYQINIDTGNFNWLFEFPEDEWFYTVLEKNENIFLVNTKLITTSR
jgi:outer membrane protein assembly factor BamB